jgi:arylsulfatase A-like enzyme
MSAKKQKKKEGQKPNVILIMADQLRADALGCMGNDIVKTPHIDRLAAVGVTFDRAFTNCPVCMASRAAILTGRYPRTIRNKSMDVQHPDEVFMSETFKRGGYRTGMFGKLHITPELYTLRDLHEEHELGDAEPFLKAAGLDSPGMLAAAQDRYKKNYGFDVDFPVADNNWGHYFDWLEKVSPDLLPVHVSENWGNARNGTGFGQPPSVRYYQEQTYDLFDSKMPAQFHPSSYIVEKAIEFVKGSKGSPFFAHVSFVDPHHPFNAPQPYSKMYKPEDMPVPPKYDRKACYPEGLPEGVRIGIDKRYNYPDETFQYALANYYGMISNIDWNVGRLLDELEAQGILDNTLIVFTADHGEHVGDHRQLYKCSTDAGTPDLCLG